MAITQQEAAELFGLREERLYVCDGKKECGRPSCAEYGREDVCHRTSDISHALYADHDLDSFERFPSSRGGEAVLICVEPIRG